MLRGGNVSRAMQVLRADPRLLLTLGIGKLRKLVPPPSSPHLGNVGSVRFEFDFALSPTVSMMYRSTYQPEIRHALRALLHRGDTFVDIGANIGYVAALAADIVGIEGTVLAMEPVPAYFQRLERLAELNPELDLRVIAGAASDADGKAPIELNTAGNVGMNSLVEGFIPQGQGGERVEVRLLELDSFLTREQLRPTLIKVDVEGYEARVMRSLHGFVERTGSRLGVLLEITPSAWMNQAESLDDFERQWRQLGFEFLDPLSLKALERVDHEHQTDVLISSTPTRVSSRPIPMDHS